ncbi:MAG: EAL domain-containing protein [Rhodospirillales bacterium]|jgi:EAL domain-containing protein (putative c-di-GMP-specific phosphodiesterase class I)|nr:EAL domain-containing protein [Rhodospirillales bacterium]
MAPQNGQKRNASQENLLLDYVRRLEKHQAGRQAVHIRLSGLRPFNRREHHVRVAADSFEPLIKGLHGQLFILKNSDLFFIFKTGARADVDGAIQKIRYLFSDDPLLADEDEDQKKFARHYDVEKEFDKILHLAQSMADEEKVGANASRQQQSGRAALKSRQTRGTPLTPEVLARVETALARADLSNLVRRQFVCGVSSQGVPEPAFSELFISIQDLRETLLPGVNLAGNRWLFQHLTESLDRRMLAMLSKTDQITITGDISFNLNVSTILSPDFLAFDDNITASRRGSLVVEIEKTDIFADLSAFLFARNFVQQRGYRICIDNLTFQTMPLLDRERLGADFIKLTWDPEMADGGDELQERVRAMVRRASQSRVVMCRCDDREAIDFGQSVGVQFFQGRQVENLIAEDNRRRELLRLKRRIERS